MDVKELSTHAEMTWCPGCTNYAILNADKMAIKELVEEGYEKDDFVVVSGIGCHAKIYDYLNINGFYSIHGRVPPTAIGIKLANPKLKVIGHAGDGDAYAEGISHLIHAARYNADITMVIHNNQVFALTTGQMTPTSPKGYKGKSTPHGAPFKPLNPIVLMLESGATFVAREYALDLKNLKETLKKAIKHKGFSFVEVIQPCITFQDTRAYFKEHMYRIEPMNKEEALEVAKSWNYMLEDKQVPFGIFYEAEEETMEDAIKPEFWAEKYPKRDIDVKKLLDKFL